MIWPTVIAANPDSSLPSGTKMTLSSVTVIVFSSPVRVSIPCPFPSAGGVPSGCCPFPSADGVPSGCCPSPFAGGVPCGCYPSPFAGGVPCGPCPFPPVDGVPSGLSPSPAFPCGMLDVPTAIVIWFPSAFVTFP